MLELIFNFDRQRYPRTLRTTFCVVCAVACLLVADAHAHELEDGFVERSVAVVVRPGEATINYSIGANEATRQQLVNVWRRDDDASFLKAVGDSLVNGMHVEVDGKPISLSLVEVLPTPRHHVEATVVMRLKLPSPVAGARSVLLEFHDRNFQKCTGAPNISNPELQTAPSNTAPSNTAPSNTAPANSQPVPVAMGGAFRYALKGANGAMLNRSTVAPILVRAKRRLVAEIPAEQLDAEQQFSAEVILP